MLCHNPGEACGNVSWTLLEITKSFSCNLILITVIYCYFALLQCTRSRMNVRDNVVLHDCIAQLRYANGALRSRDTARMRSTAPEMFPIRFEGNRLQCPDGPAVS